MKKYGKKSVPLQPILLIMYINNIKLFSTDGESESMAKATLSLTRQLRIWII